MVERWRPEESSHGPDHQSGGKGPESSGEQRQTAAVERLADRDREPAEGRGSEDTRAEWERRFDFRNDGRPVWASEAPYHVVYSHNAGTRQLWSWDLSSGTHSLVTDRPTGPSGRDFPAYYPWVTRLGTPSPDGDRVVWFEASGSDPGRFVVTPFTGGETRALAPTLWPGWAMGCSLRAERSAIGLTRGDRYTIAIVEDGQARTVIERDRPVAVVGLSADAELLALAHTERGDYHRPGVEVVTLEGGPLAEAFDGPGNAVYAAGWSPVRGDTRLALITEHSGRCQAEIWDCRTGRRTPCGTDLPGEVEVEDWWPDGSALLLAHTHLGHRTLWRYDLHAGAAEPLGPRTGVVSAARVRPDGAVWYTAESPTQSPMVQNLSAAGETQPAMPGDHPAPAGTEFRSVHYANGEGGEVHAFLAEPAGERPHPLLVFVHGGPDSHVGAVFEPFVQACVDHGFAVLMPNYRGSTGYGKQWREALFNDPGRPELVDLKAGRDRMVGEGIADPNLVVLCGYSWGGYLALQGIGTQPDAWSAAIAFAPIADAIAVSDDAIPRMKAHLLSLFGVTPREREDLYRERSPITYAAQVRTPVLITAGADDVRVPQSQIDRYVARLAESGVPHRYVVFPGADHPALFPGTNPEQLALSLDFLAEHLGTTPARRGGR